MAKNDEKKAITRTGGYIPRLGSTISLRTDTVPAVVRT